MPYVHRVLALATSAVLWLGGGALAQSVESVAQLPKTMSVAELATLKGDIAIASGLVRIGQAEKDPHALLVAARILAGLKADVALPRSTKPGEKPAMFDVGALVNEAKGYAAGNQPLLDALSAVDIGKPQHNCYWAWECNDVYCDRYYICTTD